MCIVFVIAMAIVVVIAIVIVIVVISVAMSAHGSPSVSPRAPRGLNDAFSVSDLVASLSELAKDRDCCEDWQLSTYVKTRRSQGPDKEGLVAHARLLGIILDHAPGGRPGQVALKDAWMALQRRYAIQGTDTAHTEVWADKCALKIRLALKHLLDIRAARPKSLAPEICMLMDKVRDTNGGCTPQVVTARYSPSMNSSPAAQPSPSSSPKKRRILRQSSSEASVELVHWKCNCAVCSPPPVVSLSQASSSADAREEAAANSCSVPCGRGAVKAALKKPASAQEADHGAWPGPIKIVSRRSPAQQYIMAGKSYIVAVSEKQHKDYQDIIRMVHEAMLSGSVSSQEEAKKMAKDLMKLEPRSPA